MRFLVAILSKNFSITEYRKNKLKSDLTNKILSILNDHVQL